MRQKIDWMSSTDKTKCDAGPCTKQLLKYYFPKRGKTQWAECRASRDEDDKLEHYPCKCPTFSRLWHPNLDHTSNYSSMIMDQHRWKKIRNFVNSSELFDETLLGMAYLKLLADTLFETTKHVSHPFVPFTYVPFDIGESRPFVNKVGNTLGYYRSHCNLSSPQPSIISTCPSSSEGLTAELYLDDVFPNSAATTQTTPVLRKFRKKLQSFPFWSSSNLQ